MIPAYQMHNVLKALTKNLVHDGRQPQPKGSEVLTGSVRIETTAEGKRKAVTQKVTAAILKKITQLGSGQVPGPDTDLKQMTGNTKRSRVSDGNGARFTYTSVDDNGEKSTRTRFVKDADLVTGPPPGGKRKDNRPEKN